MTPKYRCSGTREPGSLSLLGGGVFIKDPHVREKRDGARNERHSVIPPEAIKAAIAEEANAPSPKD